MSLQGRRALVAGGTEAAARKVELLLSAGAQVTLIADTVVGEIAQLIDEGRISWAGRVFDEADLAGVSLVVVASDDEGLQARVSLAAQQRCLPVNVVDRPILSYIVEEARAAGIEHIVFVARRIRRKSTLAIPLSGAAVTGRNGGYRNSVWRHCSGTDSPVSGASLESWFLQYWTRLKKRNDTQNGWSSVMSHEHQCEERLRCNSQIRHRLRNSTSMSSRR